MKEPQQIVSLKENPACYKSDDGKIPNSFEVIGNKNQKIFLRASSETEMKEWIEAILNTSKPMTPEIPQKITEEKKSTETFSEETKVFDFSEKNELVWDQLVENKYKEMPEILSEIEEIGGVYEDNYKCIYRNEREVWMKKLEIKNGNKKKYFEPNSFFERFQTRKPCGVH